MYFMFDLCVTTLGYLAQINNHATSEWIILSVWIHVHYTKKEIEWVFTIVPTGYVLATIDYYAGFKSLWCYKVSERCTTSQQISQPLVAREDLTEFLTSNARWGGSRDQIEADYWARCVMHAPIINTPWPAFTHPNLEDEGHTTIVGTLARHRHQTLTT
jgi:hypothetical protein